MKQVNYTVQLMKDGHTNECSDLDTRLFPDNSATPAQLKKLIRSKNAMPLVATDNEGKVLGFHVMAVHHNGVHGLRTVVDPEHRMMGIGRKLLKYQFRYAIKRTSWYTIRDDCPHELLLMRQGFLFAVGFKAYSIQRISVDLPDAPTTTKFVYRYQP